jgi:ATP-dependent exoDNAse (exonuclease V) beta subunit
MAERLAIARSSARLRSQRPLTGAVSDAAPEGGVAAEIDLSLEIPSEEEERPTPPPGRADAVGAVIHRILEILPLGGDLEAALRSVEPMAIAAVSEAVSPGESAEVEGAVREWMGRFPRTRLATRLKEIAGGILGRELPFVARPEGDSGPLGATIGVIDLLYRDPESGGIVVADYKTDRIGSEEETREIVDRYEAQARGYVRAIQRALDLPGPPRFELWLLGPDRIAAVTLMSLPGGGSPS